MPGLEQTLQVALSGYGREEDLRCSREAGFHNHLVKPALECCGRPGRACCCSQAADSGLHQAESRAELVKATSHPFDDRFLFGRHRQQTSSAFVSALQHESTVRFVTCPHYLRWAAAVYRAELTIAKICGRSDAHGIVDSRRQSYDGASSSQRGRSYKCFWPCQLLLVRQIASSDCFSAIASLPRSRIDRAVLPTKYSRPLVIDAHVVWVADGNSSLTVRNARMHNVFTNLRLA